MGVHTWRQRRAHVHECRLPALFAELTPAGQCLALSTQKLFRTFYGAISLIIT
jgi:hypothetical protein